MIIPLGEVSVGGIIPTALSAFGALEGNLNGQLAIQGNLSLTLTAGPPSVAAATQIAASVMLSVTTPTFAVGLSANLEAIAIIQAQLSALAGIFAALGVAGIYLFAYEGPAASMGSEVGSAVGGGLPGGSGSDNVNALVIATSSPASWAALSMIFKVS